MDKRMSSIVNDIKMKYAEKMITELNKFLEVYNKRSNESYTFKMDQYPFIIRMIGNYVARLDMTDDKWLDTEIVMSDEVSITMSVFLQSPNDEKERVKTFLGRLKKAFHHSLDDDVHRYLATTSDFTDDEKEVCFEFYSRVSLLNNAMKAKMFNDTSSDILSNETISSYAKELKSFNEYSRYISSKKEIALVIQRFDSHIKRMASEKTPSDIFFDV